MAAAQGFRPLVPGLVAEVLLQGGVEGVVLQPVGVVLREQAEGRLDLGVFRKLCPIIGLSQQLFSFLKKNAVIHGGGVLAPIHGGDLGRL